MGGVGFFFSFIWLFRAELERLVNARSGSTHRIVVLAAAHAAISLLIVAGASTMARLRSVRLRRAASILAILPCHLAWLIGLPAGLCAWTVLNRPDVRAAFSRQESCERDSSDWRTVPLSSPPDS